MLPITYNDEMKDGSCPIRHVLSQVTGKWRILILMALEDGALRFGETKRAIGEITQRVLTENLRGLEREGYLTRTVIDGPPVAVSYALTERGVDLVERLKPLIYWANSITTDVKRSRASYDKKNS